MCYIALYPAINYKFYLCVLLVCAINNRSTADLSNLLPMPIEGPAANLVTSYDIFDKQNSAIEPQAEFIKELHIF